MTIRNLDALFKPRAIALIGANRRAGSVGDLVARNLAEAGFPGALMWLDRKGGEIAGQPVWSDVASLPACPDLAVIATPAETVPGLVRELAERGCRAAVVISAGFEGAGRAAELKQAMLDAARPRLMRIVGPNCLGVISPAAGVNASFAARMPPAGRIALVAQSGAIAAALMDSAAERGFGFSHVVTVGDCADVDVGDMLDWLALDRGTDAVLLYLEGVADARKFMSAARAAARLKPVAVLKSGRSAAGARAAFSHTGALAGASAVYEAAFRRAGLLQVEGLGDLLEAAAAFAAGLEGSGERVAVLTNGGGAGVLAADALDRLGERLATLSPQTIAALEATAPAGWSRSNPVDILGDAGPKAFSAALETLVDSSDVDAVLVLDCPTAVADSDEVASAVASAAAERGAKAVLAAWLGGTSMAEGRRRLAEAGLPAYATPEAVATAFALLAKTRRTRAMLAHAPSPPPPPPDPAGAQRIVMAALRSGRRTLSDPEARLVLRAYGVPVVESREARTPAEAGAAAERLGGAVALKIVSPQLTHKTDVGGVVLDLTGREAVIEAAKAMLAGVAQRRPDASIDGFVVEPMVRRTHAQELLVGLAQDPAFGPVVMVGHGGVAVELLADRALGLPPLNDELAREMIARTRVARLPGGFRGRPGADLAALSQVLVAIARIACDLPEIAELDINPLLCDASGVLGLDARIALQPPAAAVRPAILPYPAALERSVAFGQATVLLRPVRPDDAAALASLVAGCTAVDIRFRFGDTLRTLHPELAASLTQIDYDRQLALVAETEAGMLAGCAHLSADPEGVAAEFALLVRSDLQRQGLGRLLLAELIVYARSRGVTRIWGDAELDNAGMIRLARNLGFEICPDEDPGRVRFELDLGPRLRADT